MPDFQPIDACAFILAGGKSSRMGSDKGLVNFQGREMISWVIDVLKERFEHIGIISGNREYEKFNQPLYEDIIPGKGPLAGIYTGLERTVTEWNFFIACDMPFITTGVIDSLWTNRYGYQAVVAWYNNLPESMCAFYHTGCIPVIESRLAKGQNKIQDMFTELKTNAVDFTGRFAEGIHPFRNFNTRHDIKTLK